MGVDGHRLFSWTESRMVLDDHAMSWLSLKHWSGGGIDGILLSKQQRFSYGIIVQVIFSGQEA